MPLNPCLVSIRNRSIDPFHSLRRKSNSRFVVDIVEGVSFCWILILGESRDGNFQAPIQNRYVFVINFDRNTTERNVFLVLCMPNFLCRDMVEENITIKDSCEIEGKLEDLQRG